MQDGAEVVQIPPVVSVSASAAASSSNNNNRAPMHRARPARGPGMAVRSVADLPPIPPPRPESTLTSDSKPIVPAKIRTSHQPAVPSVPPRPTTDHLVMISMPPPTPPPAPPAGSISLMSPRPGPNRTQNVYVDAPLRSPTSGCSVVVKQPLSRTGSIPLPQSTSKRSPTSKSEVVGKRPLLASQQLSVIQPSSSTLKKRTDLGPSSDFDSVNSPVTTESIICRDCGRCRCKACREPRRLPEHYLCHKKCLCSTETVVDTVSGMCLVKALFYHCGKDYAAEADSVFENPCSCSGDFAAARWGCMAAMSLVMPCLLCYLPMKACSKACEAVYAKMTTIGCRCDVKMSDGSGVGSGLRNNNVYVDVYTASTGSGSSAGMPSPVDSEKRLLSEL